MHERGVEPGGEQRVEVPVAARGGDVVGVGDPGECGGSAGLQMQFEARLGGEHREIGLLRDVAESDAAHLHGVSSPLPPPPRRPLNSLCAEYGWRLAVPLDEDAGHDC